MYRNKLSISFLVFLVVFSLFNPIFASANTSDLTKNRFDNDEKTSKINQVLNQHQEMVDGDPILHPLLQELSGKEEVDVIIQLSEGSVALEKGKKALQGKKLSASEETSILRKVDTQQRGFEKKLSQEKIDYMKSFTYQHAINGVALSMKANDLEKLLEIDGVVSVDIDEEMFA